MRDDRDDWGDFLRKYWFISREELEKKFFLEIEKLCIDEEEPYLNLADIIYAFYVRKIENDLILIERIDFKKVPTEHSRDALKYALECYNSKGRKVL